MRSVVFGEKCVNKVGAGMRSVGRFIKLIPTRCKRCVCYFAVRMFLAALVTAVIVLLIVLNKQGIM